MTSKITVTVPIINTQRVVKVGIVIGLGLLSTLLGFGIRNAMIASSHQRHENQVSEANQLAEQQIQQAKTILSDLVYAKAAEKVLQNLDYEAENFAETSIFYQGIMCKECGKGRVDNKQKFIQLAQNVPITKWKEVAKKYCQFKVDRGFDDNKKAWKTFRMQPYARSAFADVSGYFETETHIEGNPNFFTEFGESTSGMLSAMIGVSVGNQGGCP